MVNAPTEQPSSLPDDVAALQAMVLAQRAEFAELQAARLAHEAELGAELAAARAGLIEQRFEIEALKTRLSKLLRLSFGTSSEKLRTQVEQLELTLGDIDELLGEIGADAATSDYAAADTESQNSSFDRALPRPEHAPPASPLRPPPWPGNPRREPGAALPRLNAFYRLATRGCYNGSLMLASNHPPKQAQHLLNGQGGRHRTDTPRPRLRPFVSLIVAYRSAD